MTVLSLLISTSFLGGAALAASVPEEVCLGKNSCEVSLGKSVPSEIHLIYGLNPIVIFGSYRHGETDLDLEVEFKAVSTSTRAGLQYALIFKKPGSSKTRVRGCTLQLELNGQPDSRSEDERVYSIFPTRFFRNSPGIRSSPVLQLPMKMTVNDARREVRIEPDTRFGPVARYDGFLSTKSAFPDTFRDNTCGLELRHSLIIKLND